MTADRFVLDADTVAYVLQNRPRPADALESALADGATVYVCPVVEYQVSRGLRKKQAAAQLAFFETLVPFLLYDDLTRDDWDRASDLWAGASSRGMPVDDADVLIAAYTIRRDAILVTNNTRHFQHFPLKLENWLDPTPAS